MRCATPRARRVDRRSRARPPRRRDRGRGRARGRRPALRRRARGSPRRRARRRRRAGRRSASRIDRARRPWRACRARAGRAGARRSCRRRRSSCAGPPSRTCRLPSGIRRGARRELVADRAQVHHRLHGIDQVGKSRVESLAGRFGDPRRLAGDVLDRMQHDEAGAIGEEIGDRARPRAEKRSAAVGAADDLGAVGEFLRRVPGDRIVGDAEAVRVLLDRRDR